MKRQLSQILNSKKAVFNAFWAIFSKLLSGLKISIIGILLARFSGPEVYGTYSYVISFVMLFSVLAEFRLHNILLREIPNEDIPEDKILGSSLLTCLGFSLLGYLVLSISVTLAEADKGLRYYVLIYGITYFFQIIRFLRAFFMAKYLNGVLFQAESLVSIIIVMSAVVAGFMGYGLNVFLALRLIDIALVAVMLLVFYIRLAGNPLDWKMDRDTARFLIKSSLPLVLSSMALVIFQQFDKIMLKQMMGEYSVGQYNAAASLISLIVFIPIALSETLGPYMAKYKKELSVQHYQAKVQVYSDYVVWLSIALSVGIMLTSSLVINTIYGSEYREAIEVLRIFSWQGLFIALGAIAAQIMIVDNTHQIAYFKSLLGGLLNIVLNLVWIPKFGIMGAVWASILAYVLSSYLAHILIPRYRYIFVIQSKSIAFGLLNIIHDLRTNGPTFRK